MFSAATLLRRHVASSKDAEWQTVAYHSGSFVVSPVSRSPQIAWLFRRSKPSLRRFCLHPDGKQSIVCFHAGRKRKCDRENVGVKKFRMFVATALPTEPHPLSCSGRLLRL